MASATHLRTALHTAFDAAFNTVFPAKTPSRRRFLRNEAFQGLVIGAVLTVVWRLIGRSAGLMSDFGVVPDVACNAVLMALICAAIGYGRTTHWER